MIAFLNDARACHVLLLFPFNFDRMPIGVTHQKAFGKPKLCVLIRGQARRNKTHFARIQLASCRVGISGQQDHLAVDQVVRVLVLEGKAPTIP